MTGRPNKYDTLRFALETLKRIPRRPRRITAVEMHEQLQANGITRDIRSLQRLLDELTQQIPDIERNDASRPYWYAWKANATGLALPSLGQPESLLLTLAEQHLATLLPGSITRSLAGYFDQARRNLAPHAEATLAGQWPGKVRVVTNTQPMLPPKINAGVFEVVTSALYANHFLNVTYVNASGIRRESEVMPLGLAQQGVRLFLVCRFRRHNDDRSLALHRISRAREMVLDVFTRPNDFDLARFDADGQFAFGNGDLIRITVRFAKAAGLHLIETPLSKDQTVREMRNAYVITATVVDTPVLRRWLLGFGDDATIVAPPGFWDKC